MKKIILSLFLTLSFIFVDGQNKYTSAPVEGRWSTERINDWYAKQPWLVGCNYYPATAINQIDMWQKSTWDPQQIKKELDWAKDMGMNTLRVFLHDLVWAADEKGFYKRMDEFLDICKKRDIRPWFVFFDDCHYPNPQLGVQPLPIKAFHNSGWVNCPARDVASRYAEGKTTKQEEENLKNYIQHTLKRFANDKRVLMWELYNEPGRGNSMNGNKENTGVNPNMGDRSSKLVYSSWVWAREVNPSQPIMSCSIGSVGKANIKINHINSDLFSIHCYKGPNELRQLIAEHQAENRPVIVSEWLARKGSTPKECLPVLKEMKAGCTCWGFVSGKSETNWSWKSRLKDGQPRNMIKEREEGNVVKENEKFPEPPVWFHDLLRMDGTPFDKSEIEIFRRLTKK